MDSALESSLKNNLKNPMFINLDPIKKPLTISEYINYKTKDIVGIDNLKKELENNLANYKNNY